MKVQNETLEAQLLRLSFFLSPTGCRIWTGLADKNGYGKIKRFKRDMKTHRIAWEIAYGPIPDGLCVCHHCDMPPCIEPTHLFVGTNADNTADKMAKGRHTFGDKHWSRTQPEKLTRGDDHWSRKYPERVPRGDQSMPRRYPELMKRGMAQWQAKFTDDQIRTIRADPRIQVEIARDYGVTQAAISSVKRRHTWKHVL